MATFTQMRDEMKTCPYNPLHKVSARRLQQHIVKCSKNPENPVLLDCPFNALHKLAPNQLQEHILMCKDSRQVIREIEESRNRTNPIINSAVIHRTDNPISEEDWDQEIDKEKATTYIIPGLVEKTDDNDSDKESGEFAFKTNIEIQCMKPSDRKKYYKEMVEKAKEKQLESDFRDKSSSKPSFSRSDADSGKSTDNKSPISGTSTQVKSESDLGVRKPNTIPFRKLQGIGRGNTPSMTTKMQTNRQIGRADDNTNYRSISIKREREENSSEGVKRFSPDLC